MQELIRLFTQIALLKRGPQDVPASSLLLALTIAAYFSVNLVSSVLLPPFPGPLLLRVLADVAFTYIWYVLLLRFAGKPERFLQTTTAVFGFQCLLSPPLIAAAWLARIADDSVWQLPVTLVVLFLIVWIVAANGRVVQAALDWTMPPSIALVIMQTLADNLLLAALFPQPAGAVPQ
ncbi:MAG TPA: hypothetical protein VJQ47_01260 [Steroidobacteraceae bacterium]|nr:hypothetical protein [Steroidobacteraceae bacterium]